MDFNDIDNRLKRIYISLGERYSENIEPFTKIKRSENEIFVSFNEANEAENQDKIMHIIHNLANLKDNITNKLEEKGIKSNFAEKEINSSLYLQLITDLSNEDKHGYPLKKTNRSNRYPVIRNVYSGLVKPNKISGEESGTIVIDADGKPTFNGSLKIAINAEVCDGSNNFICDFDEMIDNAMLIWESFIKINNIL